jgi:transcriptional regulator with GAF, ATPase, and Fis domain
MNALPMRHANLVSQKRFRSDLYYRLNVFPVELPPLRDRHGDIPELIFHFVKSFAGRMCKSIRVIPSETMAAFTSYSWPGNIRELQNLIERAVICSEDGVLPNTVSVSVRTPPRPQTGASPSCKSDTFTDSVRSLILRTLEDTGWLIGGPDGAAARLGLPRTSLISKMKKLGISRPRNRDVTSPIAERTETGL